MTSHRFDHLRKVLQNYAVCVLTRYPNIMDIHFRCGLTMLHVDVNLSMLSALNEGFKVVRIANSNGR